MDLIERIINSKEDFYNVATEYYYNIGQDDKLKQKIINKSIAILIDHLFIPVPCIEIKIEVHNSIEEKYLGHYILYLNEEKEFLDEFLIFD